MAEQTYHGLDVLSAAATRINDRLAQTAMQERSGVTFICECGKCGLTFVALQLDEFDEIRARDDLVLAPGH